LSEKFNNFLEVSQLFACANSELQWLVFQTAAGRSCPNFHYYPLTFLPNDAQYLHPQYLHHGKPIITCEFQWKFNFRASKNQ